MPEQTTDLLKTREQFFRAADIHTHPQFCGDEREAVGEDLYLHIFGGIANTAYTLMVLQEAAKPGSVEQPFDVTVASMVPLLLARDIRAGVHSDDHAEHSIELHTERQEGEIGCGYIKLRQAISELIGKRGDEIIGILRQQDPILYGSEQACERARSFIETHANLAGRAIFPNGRQVALAAIKAGAPYNMVSGDHVGKAGILDKRPGFTLDSTEALRHGLPTYDHDTWAAKATFDEIHDLYPYDEVDYEIANDVDAVGTMLALGVEDIAVRR